MKSTVPRLKIGDVVQATIVEALGQGAFIVEFDGDLVRVENHSAINFQLNQTIRVAVTRLKPLGLRLLIRKPGSFEVQV